MCFVHFQDAGQAIIRSMQKTPGFVLAVVESQKAVGKKQFERANYYTGKTMIFDADNFKSLVATSLN